MINFQYYPLTSCPARPDHEYIGMPLFHDEFSPIPVDLSQQWHNIPTTLVTKDDDSNHHCPTTLKEKKGVIEENIDQVQENPKISRPYVDHTYVDFSSVDDERICRNSAYQIIGETMQSIMTKGRGSEPKDIVIVRAKTTNRFVQTFPMKLVQLLLEVDAFDCVTWLPHGRSFRVLDSDLLMKKFSPQTFKATLYRSFERQLNIWGFKRFTCGVDFNSYYHPMFLRGKPNLAMNMTRKMCKLGCKPRPNPGEEPDFYALSMLRPLP